MNRLKPVTVEYIRRISILILLSLFAWMFFYIPSDIYEIGIKNYKELYEIKLRRGIIDPQTSLQQYIGKQMQGPYWRSSPITPKVLELEEGESAEFLKRIAADNHGESTDSFIQAHHNNSFTTRDSYFFRSYELPPGFESAIISNKADFLSVRDNTGEKQYFKFYPVKENSSLQNAPNSIKYPIRNYAYLLIILALIIYLLIPRPKVPQGAAYYTKLNAVYLPDALGVFLWTGAWMFFFLPDDSAPIAVKYFLLLFLGLFAVAILIPTMKYASNWYLFKDDFFQWSGVGGIQSISLDDVVSVKPYKRQLPKWVAPLIILFGRGQPGATGIGLLTGTAAPEIGMEITSQSGKKVRVMANYLKGDELFTKKFQQLEGSLNK